uniref:Putative secreted protein n=1 Tax=Anopheles marajoara TaxID=58244 RepID=A0A2M4C7B4_9DIPT
MNDDGFGWFRFANGRLYSTLLPTSLATLVSFLAVDSASAITSNSLRLVHAESLMFMQQVRLLSSSSALLVHFFPRVAAATHTKPTSLFGTKQRSPTPRTKNWLLSAKMATETCTNHQRRNHLHPTSTIAPISAQ